MSTIHSSPAFGCFRPNRAHESVQRLAALLAIDQSRRCPPPVSLPVRCTNTASGLTPAPPVALRVQCEPHLEFNSRIYCCEAEPEDGRGPYSHAKLLQMNARFVQRLERAFANG